MCDTVLEDHEILPHWEGDFLLIVRGDSMIGDGILSGDKVLIRPVVQVNNGEIAAVHVGDDHLATLKRILFDNDQVILRASNPAYPDIVLPQSELKVAGVYRGLVRNRP